MNELQRTYRGKAWRDAQPAERVDVERAVVVASLDGAPEEQDDRMAEFAELLKTAGAVPVATVVQRRDRPVPRTYLGSGKLEELAAIVEREKPDLVAAEGALSAGQQRHLEDRLKIRVVNRTAVILDIFAQHAHTAEGKLQVELAQLEYSYSRQEGLWQHLERLRRRRRHEGPRRDPARVGPAAAAQPHGDAAPAAEGRGPLAGDPARPPRRLRDPAAGADRATPMPASRA